MCLNKKIYYSPNNSNFSKQGAVSSKLYTKKKINLIIHAIKVI